MASALQPDVLSQALQTQSGIDASVKASPDYQQTVKAAEEARAANDDAAATLKKLQPQYEKIGKELIDMPPVPDADLKSSPAPPKDADYIKDPMRVFGQFMPMLVAFGSLKTRNGGLNAIKAATAAMNAAKTNDKEALERAHEDWKTNMDQVLQNNQLEIEKRNEILGDRKLSAEDKLNALHLLEVESQNALQQANLKNANFTNYTQVVGTLAKSAEPLQKIVEQTTKSDEARARLAETEQYHRDLVAAAKDKPAAAAGLKWEVLQDKDGKPYRYNPETGEATNLEGTAAYHPEGATKIGTDTARSGPVMILQQFKKDFEAANGRPPNANELTQQVMNVGAKTGAAKSFATGTNGNQVRFLNVAVSHLELVRQYAEALHNGDVQAINRLGNMWKQEFGSPAPTNLNAVAQTAGQEVTKAVVAGGGGEAERQAAGKRFADYQSPAQFNGAIDASVGLLGGQLKGLEHQYEKTTGMSDFGDFLLPDTKRAVGYKDKTPAGGGSHDLPSKLAEEYALIADPSRKGYDPAKRAEAKKRLAAAGYDTSGL